MVRGEIPRRVSVQPLVWRPTALSLNLLTETSCKHPPPREASRATVGLPCFRPLHSFPAPVQGGLNAGKERNGADGDAPPLSLLSRGLFCCRSGRNGVRWIGAERGKVSHDRGRFGFLFCRQNLSVRFDG